MADKRREKKPVAAWHYLSANRHDNEEQINRIKYNYGICSSQRREISALDGAGVAVVWAPLWVVAMRLQCLELIRECN